MSVWRVLTTVACAAVATLFLLTGHAAAAGSTTQLIGGLTSTVQGGTTTTQSTTSATVVGVAKTTADTTTVVKDVGATAQNVAQTTVPATTGAVTTTVSSPSNAVQNVETTVKTVATATTRGTQSVTTGLKTTASDTQTVVSDVGTTTKNVTTAAKDTTTTISTTTKTLVSGSTTVVPSPVSIHPTPVSTAIASPTPVSSPGASKTPVSDGPSPIPTPSVVPSSPTSAPVGGSTRPRTPANRSGERFPASRIVTSVHTLPADVLLRRVDAAQPDIASTPTTDAVANPTDGDRAPQLQTTPRTAPFVRPVAPIVVTDIVARTSVSAQSDQPPLGDAGGPPSHRPFDSLPTWPLDDLAASTSSLAGSGSHPSGSPSGLVLVASLASVLIWWSLVRQRTPSPREIPFLIPVPPG